MPHVSSKSIGFGLGALLAAVAAAVAGLILFASGKAGGVALTTAEYVPEDAGLYVAFNTDLASTSWVNAFDLAQRLGEEDPEGQLHNAAAEAGLDWERDVAPFLGGNAAFYVKGVDFSQFDVQGGVVVRCNDCPRAIQVLRREADMPFQGKSYRGFDYLAGDTLFIGANDDHMFLAPNEGSLFEMLDLAAGDGGSLADAQDFKHLRDELSPNFLSFVYLSAEDLAFGEDAGDGAIRQAFEEAGVGDIALKPMALAIGAKDAGFESQAAAVGDPGASAPMLEPRTSAFADLVPAYTAIYFSTHGVADAWKAALEQAGPEIDEAVREATDYNSLDEALRAAGNEIGLDSIEDIISQMDGEAAVAVWFPNGSLSEPAAVLLAEVVNPLEATRLILTIVEQAAGRPPKTETIAGTTVFSFDDDSAPSFAVRGDQMILGTEAAIRAVLELTGPSLADDPGYRATLAGLSAPTGTFAYIDLAAFPEFSDFAQSEGFAERLGPAIVDIVSYQGLARLLAFVSVPE